MARPMVMKFRGRVLVILGLELSLGLHLGLFLELSLVLILGIVLGFQIWLVLLLGLVSFRPSASVSVFCDYCKGYLVQDFYYG
jgi:cation transporter-like permease